MVSKLVLPSPDRFWYWNWSYSLKTSLGLETVLGLVRSSDRSWFLNCAWSQSRSCCLKTTLLFQDWSGSCEVSRQVLVLNTGLGVSRQPQYSLKTTYRLMADCKHMRISFTGLSKGNTAESLHVRIRQQWKIPTHIRPIFLYWLKQHRWIFKYKSK